MMNRAYVSFLIGKKILETKIFLSTFLNFPSVTKNPSKVSEMRHSATGDRSRIVGGGGR